MQNITTSPFIPLKGLYKKAAYSERSPGEAEDILNLDFMQKNKARVRRGRHIPDHHIAFYTASKTGTTVTKTVGTDFVAGDVNRFLVWLDGTVDKIASITSTTVVEVDTSGTQASQRMDKYATTAVFLNKHTTQNTKGLGLCRYYKNTGEKWTIAAQDEYVCARKDGKAWATITSGQSTLNPYTFATWDHGWGEILYYTNGANTPQKWYGTGTSQKLGIDAPTSKPTLAASGVNGTLTGSYYYKTTYVNYFGHESNGYMSDEIVCNKNTTIALSSIPTSSDAQVTARRIYRTSAGGAYFFFVKEIADNTTTTYSDTATDADLGITEPPTDHDPAPILKGVVFHKNMLAAVGVGNDKNTVYFSKPGEPESWPPTYGLSVSSDDGDEVKVLCSYRDALYVFKRNSIWVILGTNTTNFVVKNITHNMGCIASYSLAQGKNNVYFLSEDNVWKWDGANYEVIGNEAVKAYLLGASQAHIAQASGVFHDHKYIVSITPGGRTFNEKCLVYFTLTGEWSIWDHPAAFWASYSGGDDVDGLYFIKSDTANDARVFRAEVKDTDEGNKISWYHTGGPIQFGEPNQKTMLRKIWYEATSTVESVTCDVWIDGTGSNTAITISPTVSLNSRLGPTGDFYLGPTGHATLGTCKLANMEIKVHPQSCPQGLVAYKHKLKFSGTTPKAEIAGYSMGHRPRPKH